MSLAGRALEILRNDGVFRLLYSARSLSMNRAEKIQNRVIYPQYNRLRHRIKYKEAAPKPNKLIDINPRKVEYLLTPHYWKRVSKYTTHVRDGNWDKSYSDQQVVISGRHEGISAPVLVSFNNFIFYESCKEHFLRGVPWEDTKLYNLLLENQDSYWSYYNSEKNIKETLESVENLYLSIKNNGYLHQEEVDSCSFNTLGNDQYPHTYHEVAVNIGRDGEIIFDDGRHRFVIAKLLQIPSIPVRVLVRHKQWQEIRHKITKASSPEELSIQARSHLGHPDLVDVTPESWS